jgi:hypothetical protein
MIWLIACGFGFLAASVFLKNIMIYIALIVTWAGVIYYGESSIPDYIRLAGVAVVIFGIISIYNLKKGGDF